MIKEQQIHMELIAGISQQMKSVLESSRQAVYIYLDDIHKACNQKFATMLGYRSPEEWASVTDNFPSAFVEKNSQQTLVTAYQDAMEKMIAADIKVTWKKKSGGSVATSVIMVPVEYEGHLFALHFIS
jgi:hypothetical protein